MDPWIASSGSRKSCSPAVRTEFKHLEYYYFHNFLYERVWRQNRRGYNEWTPTWEVMNTYGPDWKAIFVGDATMSPFEITEVGGSIEHWNEEPELWLRRFLATYPDAVWLTLCRRNVGCPPPASE